MVLGRNAGARLALANGGLERAQLLLERGDGGRRQTTPEGERLGLLLGVKLRGGRRRTRKRKKSYSGQIDRVVKTLFLKRSLKIESRLEKTFGGASFLML